MSLNFSRFTRPGAVAILSFAFTSLSAVSQQSPVQIGAAQNSRRAAEAFGKLPLSFEPNRGQTDAQVQFLARTPEASVFLTGSDAVLETTRFRKDEHGTSHVDHLASVRMHLAGAAVNPVAQPEQPLAGTINYMKGNDKAGWQTNIPTFGGVRLSSVYPGIDLKYYGNAGHLEYDFLLAPHADPSAIKLQFQGAHPRLSATGDLLLPASGSKELRFDKPVVYQMAGDRRQPIEASFTIAANEEVSFRLGAYDRSRELVIDPTLIYLGTLGSGAYPAYNNVGQVAVDSTGALYFIGTTEDPNFPVTAGALQTVCGPTAGNNGQVTYYGGYCPAAGNGETSAYISKLSADGTKLVYSTYLSGKSGTERGVSLAVDAAGVAYLLGITGSNDFPVTADAFQKSCTAYYGFNGIHTNLVPCDGYYNGGGTQYTILNQIAFFAKLNAAGNALLYSSFLGGTGPVYPNTTVLDASGNWYIGAQTNIFDAADLAGGPVNQPQIQYPGVTASGYQTSSTAVDGYGNLTATNAAFALSKFSNDGRTLQYGTFLADRLRAADVNPTTIAVGASGVAFLAGYSNAANYPTTAAAIKKACTTTSPGYGGLNCTDYDGFLAAIDTTKSGAASLVYSTRIGGSSGLNGAIPGTIVYGVAADSSNNAYITGYTSDHLLPVGTGGYQAACPNYAASTISYDYCDSAYVLKINPAGTTVLAGTFLGGPNFRSSESVGYNIRLDSQGRIYVYGRSNDGGGDFPQVNPLQPYKGGNQLFISTFTADLGKLLFSTRFGNPSYTDHNVAAAGGLVLDANDNIYFAGTTNDATFAGTAGTYSTPSGNGGNPHTFFAKLSKVFSPTATTLTLPAATVTAGNTLVLKATVQGTVQTTPAPTGPVTFTYTGTTPATVAGTATLDATGTATLTTTAPAAGSYPVVATYAGDTTYDVSTSAAGTLTVNQMAVPAITLTATPGAGKVDTRFQLSVTVASPAGTPTGTVYFMDGATTLGSSTLAGGQASYSTLLSTGTHTLTARYSGDSAFAAVSSTPQNASVTTYSTSTSLASSAASAAPGTQLTFTAAITASGTTLVPTGTVTFLEGPTILGTAVLKGNTATLSTSTLAAGSHSITASYGGDVNFAASTSTASTVTVVAATLTLSASPASLTLTSGSSGTVTITATPTGPLTATVAFSCGAVPQHALCSFGPGTLTFNGSSVAQTTTLNLSTNIAALDPPPLTRHLAGTVLAALFLPVGLLGILRRRRPRIALLMLVLAASIATVGVSGCGSSAPSNTTGAGVYSITVNASVNGGSASLPISVTVQ